MGGGLMQLVAYGAQDIYLTGNPQITFFKVVYHKHTNFSMESIKQSFSGGTGANQSPVCTISRNGDLVYKMYLVQTEEDDQSGSADGVIKTVELEIGGQRIDIQSIDWMNTWNELSTPVSKALGLKSMQGLFGIGDQFGVNYFHIPIQFWFCRNAGLALPLIALQYHEVKVKFVLGEDARVNQGLSLYCDYIYLDTDERRRFAQGAHEYLIEQVQEQTIHKSGAQKLGFNHPVKELIWTTNNSTGAQLKLNGHDRFSKRPAEYFEIQQPYDYHTHCPMQNLPTRARTSEGVYKIETTDGNILAPGGILTSAPWPASVDDYLGFIFSNSPPFGQNSVTVVNRPSHDGWTPGRTPDSIAWADMWSQRPAQLGIFYSYWPGLEYQYPVRTAAVVHTANTIGYIVHSSIGNQLTQGNTYVIKAVGWWTGEKEVIANLDLLLPAVGTGTSSPPDNTTLLIFDVLLIDVPPEPMINTNNQLATNIADGDFSITSIAYSTVTVSSETVTVAVTVSSETHARTSNATDNIGVYSFALKPEEHQPSGTCNFSRIDSAELTFDESIVSGNIYAVNYNVLRIMSGMGGLAYSN